MNFPEKYFPFLKLYSNESDDGLTRWLKSISFLSALVSLLIFVDYFIPLNEKTYLVKNTIVRSGFNDVDYQIFLDLKLRTGEEEFWLIMDGDDMAVSENVLKEIKPGDKVLIYKTRIFGINVKGKNKSSENDFFYPFLNFYGFLLVVPIVFLSIFVLMSVYRKNPNAILNLGVVNIILLLGFAFLLLFY
jgi:hypothetical protein